MLVCNQMELFLPGLIVFVLVAFFAFLVIPKTGPMILAVASLIALIAAGVHHYQLFSYEYSLSTWQYGLASYASYIVLGLALLMIIAAISFVFMGSENKAKVMEAVATPMEQIQTAVKNSIQQMPNASSATNPLTAAINRGVNAMTGPAGPMAMEAPRPPNVTNQRSPIIPGLGFRASEA